MSKFMTESRPKPVCNRCPCGKPATTRYAGGDCCDDCLEKDHKYFTHQFTKRKNKGYKDWEVLVVQDHVRIRYAEWCKERGYVDTNPLREHAP